MSERFTFEEIINDICGMAWEDLTDFELSRVIKVYYYFSIQFRENLEIACHHYPEDDNLKVLYLGECNTDNLSPWPEIVDDSEKIDHDEFLRRLLGLQPIEHDNHLEEVGASYLREIRQIDDAIRAMSIASYEDGGLRKVFTAILRAPMWQCRGAQAFEHFLQRHIQFDTDPETGHGALSRRIMVDDRILPLWTAFKVLLLTAAPKLGGNSNGLGV
jgi:hypothetical protein